jgi:GH15 family glucan-1,4-alpha-glucosidase
MVLALMPLFVDARFRDHISPPAVDLVARLARKAIRVAGEPDAGIWEYRIAARPQTFSTLMCWAAADRLSRIAKLRFPNDADEFQEGAERIRGILLHQGVDPKRNCLVADFGGTEVDASLLQAVMLRLLDPHDPRLHATVDAVRADLDMDGWLRRYRIADGFGVPKVAFTLCTFWLVEALAMLGRLDEARAIMSRVHKIQSPLGLLSEDVDPVTLEMWGNFPQTYSHVGMIHAAFAASPRWSEVA